MNATYKKIAEQWNTNAFDRYQQIKSKIDYSYHEVLIPSIFNSLGKIQGLKGIDVGCGSGHLSSLLITKGKVKLIIG